MDARCGEVVTGDNPRTFAGHHPRRSELTPAEERDILEAALAQPGRPPGKEHPPMPGKRTILLWAPIVVTVVLRIWLAMNLPLAFLPEAGADDGLFMRHAASLLAGHWLGSYDQMTLVKGPGYPWFLALASLTGLPVSLAHVLFQLIAVGALALAILRITGSSALAVITFMALALHPVGYSAGLQRVIRDQIYWAQTLLTFALLATAFIAPSRSRRTDIGIAFLAGLFLGWTWLTREEGVWLVPGVAVLMFSGLFLGRARPVVGRMLVVGFAFLAVLGLFRTFNYIAYGSFAGVDVKSKSFEATMDALQSVQIGKRPYVPVSIEARTAIAAVSPTFAPLAEKLAAGSPLLNGWSKPGCLIYPSACGDIAGGWFMWALRGAASQAGYYKSPAIASQKFRAISEEIGQACASGKLPCSASPIPLMAWTPGLLDRLPASLLRVVERIIFLKPADGRIGERPYPAAGSHAADMWSLLNHPRIAATPVTAGEEAARAVRSATIGIYGIAAPALSIIGLVAALLLLARPKRAVRNPVALTAIAAWALVAARAAILALADASSFPSANLVYAAPASFCLVLASVLSVFAALRGVQNA
jgi:hypothetical protein